MHRTLALLLVALAACSGAAPAGPAQPPAVQQPSPSATGETPPPPRVEAMAAVRKCKEGPPMTVRFYDAGQALAALVELPDGRRILVDTGENPKRPACAACKDWHARVMDGLRRDVGDAKIDLLWITHQHSDHQGGAPDVLESLAVSHYADNGRDLEKPTPKAAHDAAKKKAVPVAVVDPEHRKVPLDDSDSVKLTAVLPQKWPDSCKSNANDCSIPLRIDYCRSSVLFTGDAEDDEEAVLEVAPVTLLQVGHHGSDTSSTEAFIAKLAPRYAVVASAKREEGTNLGYCHPRRSTVERLTRATGGAGSATILAFDAAVACKLAKDANWHEVPRSDRMWFTAKDGTIVLTTKGDGTFERTP